MATIAVVMVDGVADWEIGTILPAARAWFSDTIQIASIDGKSITSIGGLELHPTYALSDLAPLDADLWLLPGSDRWQAGEIPGLSALLQQRLEAGRGVAAICGATLALAYAGLLDTRPHTSNSEAFLREHAGVYAGSTHYQERRVVSAGGLITAPGTSPVSFAEECLRLLHPEREEQIAQMRQMFAAEFV
ncbi:type 1 glutamine amidotransferase family protein [Xanthomonas sp. LF07-6]|uniref:type 1 glutamine amidotransferase family protein n=1 Tax=Xanthomonas sp. LF07-6 TaxID=3097550 RepID=UPI002A840B5C|nr:type 1 glutamine amidotransferase family protein [Xanthomonas sp. LF07-6]MDY4338971.1 type 1 glutamine amidotransferase family protein [Xanthomonas sp. LF07-6]